MSRWVRQILFGDVDAMYASAAIVANPGLAGKLVAVGGRPPRGIITAASYPVRAFGVKSAMPTVQALRLCPDLILVPPDFDLYHRLHDCMGTITERWFPHTAWTSIDEFFADTTDLQAMHPDPSALGQAVKAALFDATGLRTTITLAANKTVAKVAANSHKPNGLAVIEPGSEASFLAPLPVRALPGIGPKTGAWLERAGIHRLGDLANPKWERMLTQHLGSYAYRVQALARGEDHEPVVADRHQKSIGHETTFEQNTADPRFLENTLRRFLSDLAHDLRASDSMAGAFTVKLKDSRFHITTRHRQFSQPLNYDPDMWRHVQPALQSLLAPRTTYRLAGLALSDLTQDSPGLFNQRTSQALAALDQIIEHHGAGAIRLGGLPNKH